MRDDINKLNIPSLAKSYARDTAKSIMRTTGGKAEHVAKFQKVNAMLLNPGKKNYYQNYDAGETTGGGRATAGGFKRPGGTPFKSRSESLAEQLVQRLIDA